MSYVILVRNPHSGDIIAVKDGSTDDDDPPIAVFETEEAAEAAANLTTVCKAWPYLVVGAP